MKTWESFNSNEQQQIQSLIKEQLEKPAWEVTARETQEGVDCLTGGSCPHGKPTALTEVAVSDKDIARAQNILIESVLPAWAAKVKPEAVKKCNDTAVKVANIQAK
mgnify:FL=1